MQRPILLFRLNIRPLQRKAHTQLEPLLENLDLPFVHELGEAVLEFFKCDLAVKIKLLPQDFFMACDVAH